jgi:hypothetical protein
MKRDDERIVDRKWGGIVGRKWATVKGGGRVDARDWETKRRRRKCSPTWEDKEWLEVRGEGRGVI